MGSLKYSQRNRVVFVKRIAVRVWPVTLNSGWCGVPNLETPGRSEGQLWYLEGLRAVNQLVGEERSVELRPSH